jgi:hypothetical protein
VGAGGDKGVSPRRRPCGFRKRRAGQARRCGLE